MNIKDLVAESKTIFNPNGLSVSDEVKVFVKNSQPKTGIITYKTNLGFVVKINEEEYFFNNSGRQMCEDQYQQQFKLIEPNRVINILKTYWLIDLNTLEILDHDWSVRLWSRTEAKYGKDFKSKGVDIVNRGWTRGKAMIPDIAKANNLPLDILINGCFYDGDI